MKKPEGKLKAVSTGEKLDGKQHYDNWAESYDSDLLDEYGYTAHILVTAKFSELVKDNNNSVVDMGCGTGLLGIELAQLGYTQIDGVDFSENMLAQAKKLNIYKRLHCLDLTQQTNLDSESYDSAICAGLFGAGHLAAKDIREIIRVTKPGGNIVMLMNSMPYSEENYIETFNLLEQEKLWKVNSNIEVNYMDNLERPGRLIAAEKL